MISSKNRFHGQGGINFVYRSGKTVREPGISLKYAPSKKDDYQLAVVVSKKVNKSAVVRNRIRRRIYEIVRLKRKESAANWPVMMVLSVHDEGFSSMPSHELSDLINRIINKIDLNKN